MKLQSNEQLAEKMAEYLHPVITLGNVTWANSHKAHRKSLEDIARQLITDLRLVQLDDDQSLPIYIECNSLADNLTRCVAEEAQQDMLRAGFVKKVGET